MSAGFTPRLWPSTSPRTLHLHSEYSASLISNWLVITPNMAVVMMNVPVPLTVCGCAGQGSVVPIRTSLAEGRLCWAL